MNKENAKDYLPLVQALAEGRTIQQYTLRLGTHTDFYWEDLDDPSWVLEAKFYRIKPEPRRAWVWWPADGSIRAEIYLTKVYAERRQSDCGGHITEVTE